MDKTKILNFVGSYHLVMADDGKIWELKEAAKWSSNSEEKKKAIKEMTEYGEAALPSLKEILDVTAYDEIKTSCHEAIKSIRENSDKATKKST